MPEGLAILHRELVYLWYYFDIQLRQILPYWVLGMLIGSAVSVFCRALIHNTFRALGGHRLGVLGILLASALGIASPLRMYGTIPIAAYFSRGGVHATGSELAKAFVLPPANASMRRVFA